MSSFLSDDDRADLQTEIDQLRDLSDKLAFPPPRLVVPLEDWFEEVAERRAGLQRHIDRLQAMLNGGAR